MKLVIIILQRGTHSKLSENGVYSTVYVKERRNSIFDYMCRKLLERIIYIGSNLW